MYLLIAATYTPVTLILPNRAWAWTIFGVAWGLTVTVIGLRALTKLPSKWITLGMYLGFTVMDAAAFSVVHTFLKPEAFLWFGLGGMAYVLATVLYYCRFKWTVIFVIFGSFGHFWGMLQEIL